MVNEWWRNENGRKWKYMARTKVVSPPSGRETDFWKRKGPREHLVSLSIGNGKNMFHLVSQNRLKPNESRDSE